MCGRFTQTYSWAEIHAMYNLVPATPRNLQPRYNIAPTTQIGVITQNEGNFTYSEMRWWLIPSWHKDSIKKVPFSYNARAEGVATSKMFRGPFQTKRCLIPATGFFEWSGPKVARLPWFISATDNRPLTFAGIYDHWKDPESGDSITSCAIITCAANAFMHKIHDRMPVILKQKDWKNWLNAPSTDLLKPADENTLKAWRVSTRVNSSRYQAEDTMEEESA